MKVTFEISDEDARNLRRWWVGTGDSGNGVVDRLVITTLDALPRIPEKGDEVKYRGGATQGSVLVCDEGVVVIQLLSGGYHTVSLAAFNTYWEEDV